MDQEMLNETIKKHNMWLRDEAGRELADLHHCNLTGADLRNTNLRHCDLTRATLRDANLYNADLRNCNLTGANLYNSDLRNCDLTRADLRDANLYNADLRNCDLTDADLYGADLRNCNIGDANLRNCDIGDANLRYADLRSAKNFFLLPVQDPRGYLHPHATLTGQGWQIRVEYHRFSIDQARAHWGESYQGKRWIGDMYLHACDWLELMIANNKEVV